MPGRTILDPRAHQTAPGKSGAVDRPAAGHRTMTPDVKAKVAAAAARLAGGQSEIRPTAARTVEREVKRGVKAMPSAPRVIAGH